MWTQELIKVSDSSQVGEIRRHSQSISKELGYDEVLAGKISIVVTELATNIIKHAGKGEIILSYSKTSFDIVSLDKGPGFDLQECLVDGFSTKGSAGSGLGAIQRNSHFFDIQSDLGKGTVIYVNFRKDVPELPETDIGGICLPYPGEIKSGDGWSFCRQDKLRIIVADGLGHGLLAHEASQRALEVFQEYSARSSMEIMNTLHLSLRSTRGAAIGLAELDREKMIFNYCSVGNVSATIAAPTGYKRCVSYNGTVGLKLNKFQNLPYPVEKDSLIIIASDGLSTHWDLKPYPGIFFRHPFVVAGVLYRDFSKGTDDVSVVVLRGGE